jgi:hypothetical protein
MTIRDGYATCLPLALSISREERFEVLNCFHVVVKMYRYSLEERVFIVKIYWITGSIKNCQRRSKRCIQLLVAGCVAVSFRVDYLYFTLSFRDANFLFANSQNTTALHYRYECKCIVFLFFLKTNIFRGYPRVGRTVFFAQAYG